MTTHFGVNDSPDSELSACVEALQGYGDLAASEAITRALVAERAGEHGRALFWLHVSQTVLTTELKAFPT